MNIRDYRAEFEALLHDQGGLYTFDDVLRYLQEGKFQSFAEGDNWVVTQIEDYPQRCVVDVVFAIGELSGVVALVDTQVTHFAMDIGATMITSTGRRGWEKFMTPGWVSQWACYTKEIGNG